MAITCLLLLLSNGRLLFLLSVTVSVLSSVRCSVHTPLGVSVLSIPCGGGVEYLHRSPATRRSREENPVPGVITGPPCSWGYKYGALALQVGGLSNLRQ
jgi:hypothetical protein